MSTEHDVVTYGKLTACQPHAHIADTRHRARRLDGGLYLAGVVAKHHAAHLVARRHAIGLDTARLGLWTSRAPHRYVSDTYRTQVPTNRPWPRAAKHQPKASFCHSRASFLPYRRRVANLERGFFSYSRTTYSSTGVSTMTARVLLSDNERQVTSVTTLVAEAARSVASLATAEAPSSISDR